MKATYLKSLIEDYKEKDYMLCTKEEILEDKVKRLEKLVFLLVEQLEDD